MPRAYVRITAVVVALLATMAVAGCAERRAGLSRLTIATGGPADLYFALGNALAAVAESRWGTRVRVLKTQASVANVHAIASGGADVGFVSLDVASMALDGRNERFQASLPIRALAGLYDDYMHVVAKTEIKSLRDLRGKRVSKGPEGSTTMLVAERLLTQEGINPGTFERRLGVDKAAEEMRSGTIDAFFFTGGIPTFAVQALARSTPIHLLPVGQYVESMRELYGEVYAARPIPKFVYNLPDVTTVAIHNLLVVSAEMSDDLAYELTKLIFEAKPQLAAVHPAGRVLDQRAAIATHPVPLHPGAMRYYREAKGVKA